MISDLQTALRDSITAQNVSASVENLEKILQLNPTLQELKTTKFHIEMSQICKGKHDERILTLAKKIVEKWRSKFPVASRSGSTTPVPPSSKTTEDPSNNQSPRKRERSDSVASLSKRSASASSTGAPEEDDAKSTTSSQADLLKTPSTTGIEIWRSTGQKKRDDLQALLIAALQSQVSSDDIATPANIAYRLETALFRHYGSLNAEYLKQFKSIRFNLADEKNQNFGRRLLVGEMAASKAAFFSAWDMASEEKRQEKEKAVKDEIWQMSSWDPEKANAVTESFRCSKCGQRKCSFMQKQTRSADEPMTTFVQCVLCKHRWKFC